MFFITKFKFSKLFQAYNKKIRKNKRFFREVAPKRFYSKFYETLKYRRL